MNKKERQEIQKSVEPDAHSAWVVLNSGEVVSQDTSYICYNPLFSPCNEQTFDELYVFFGEKVKKYDEGWCDWVVNESFFADGILTKDTKEGFKYGFQINTNADLALMKASMMVLRHAFEGGEFWCWKTFKDFGASSLEAYMLASLYVVEDGEVYSSNYNSNHLVIPRGAPLSYYEGANYKPVGKTCQETLSVVNLSKDYFNGMTKSVPVNWQLYTGVELTKSWVKETVAKFKD